MAASALKAPFPWFGGKSTIAELVWSRFGNVPNYVEPFAGSLAVLLGRPHAPHTETVNDKDCMLANFWRALQADPESVAQYADWPVNEADLHARHLWLTQREEFRERMKTDPEYFDPKIAGWWVWGLCQWIGSGWCVHPEWRSRGHAASSDRGVNRQLPNLGNAGQGVNRKRPLLGGHGGGVGVHRTSEPLLEYFAALAERLRAVRICCGNWSRVCGPSPTFKHGLTAVFLDPPYSAEANRDETIYAADDLFVAHEVREWAIEAGKNPDMRIALCGYDGEHAMPSDWECVAWKARGGYANQGDSRSPGKENADHERVWFSPHCLKQPTLFD